MLLDLIRQHIWWLGTVYVFIILEFLPVILWLRRICAVFYSDDSTGARLRSAKHVTCIMVLLWHNSGSPVLIDILLNSMSIRGLLVILGRGIRTLFVIELVLSQIPLLLKILALWTQLGRLWGIFNDSQVRQAVHVWDENLIFQHFVVPVWGRRLLCLHRFQKLLGKLNLPSYVLLCHKLFIKFRILIEQVRIRGALQFVVATLLANRPHWHLMLPRLWLRIGWPGLLNLFSLGCISIGRVQWSFGSLTLNCSTSSQGLI